MDASTTNGFASRKFVFSTITSIAVLLSGLITLRWPSFTGSLATVIGGLCTVQAVYLGANVAHQHVTTKNLAQNLNNAKDGPDDTGGNADK